MPEAVFWNVRNSKNVHDADTDQLIAVFTDADTAEEAVRAYNDSGETVAAMPQARKEAMDCLHGTDRSGGLDGRFAGPLGLVRALVQVIERLRTRDADITARFHNQMQAATELIDQLAANEIELARLRAAQPFGGREPSSTYEDVEVVGPWGSDGATSIDHGWWIVDEHDRQYPSRAGESFVKHRTHLIFDDDSEFYGPWSRAERPAVGPEPADV